MSDYAAFRAAVEDCAGSGAYVDVIMADLGIAHRGLTARPGTRRLARRLRN